MSSFAKLYASMENEEEVVEAVPEVTTDDVIEAQEVTEEVAEAEAEVEEVQEAIEEGVQDAETLETVADTLEETVEDGGADPATAQMAEVAVESIYRRLGIEKKAMPALESFNDKEQRIEATKLAVEGIRETARKVWDAIKKFFASLYEKIKNLVTKFINLFKNKLKLLLNLQNQLKSAPDNKQLPSNIANDLLGNFYDVKDNSLADVARRLSRASDLFKYPEKAASDLNGLSLRMDALNNKEANVEDIEGIIKNEVVEPFKKVFLSSITGSKKIEKESKEGFNCVLVNESAICGNKASVIYYSEDTSTGFKIKAKVISADNEKAETKEGNVDVKKADVEELIKQAIIISKATSTTNFNKILDNAMLKVKQAEKESNMTPEGLDKNDTEFRKLITYYSNSLQQFTSGISANNVNNVNVIAKNVNNIVFLAQKYLAK